MGIQESLGPMAFNIFMKFGLGLIIIIVMGILFYVSKTGFAKYKDYKNYKVTAMIINPDGSFYVNRIGKFLEVDGIDKMKFRGTKETCPVIPPKYIRNSSVVLWRYDVGQYAVIPPQVWENLDPKNFKIDVINLQQKNFAFLEQRAAVSRWAYMKDALARWAPFITIIILTISGGVITWFILNTAMDMFNQVTIARVAECAKLIGGGSTPVEVVPVGT